jgi:dihydroorotate dehydrogenase (NAD+) catalytic subunit
VVEVGRLGAICCKGTTLKPRFGNEPPRVTETPAGMLNSIGLQNPGVDAVVEKYSALWATWAVPVIVNVAGESIEDYVSVVRRLDGVPGANGHQLNISLPERGRAASAVRRRQGRRGRHGGCPARDGPAPDGQAVPNVADVRAIARAIEDGGADSISAINTLSGMAMDRARRKPFLGNTYGGLSGPAIRPVALRIVYEVAQVVRIPIVAVGGVAALDDVLDFLMAGASACRSGLRLRRPARPSGLIGARRMVRGPRPGLHRDLIGVALPPEARAPRRDRRASRAWSTGHELGAAAIDPARVEALFVASGALRSGHFALKSGRHGDRYLEKFQVLQYPEAVSEICAAFAGLVRDDAGRPTVDAVVGPTTGGVILAFETARQLGLRGLFAE